MKILRSRPTQESRGTRGAALLLSLLILLVLVAIVIQLNISTGTDARMARNDVTLTTMDLAVESAMLQELETLKADGEAEAGGGASPTAPGGAPTGAPAGAAAGAGAAGAAGGQPAASDSKRDEWANPQRTDINTIKLRIWCVDEDSKYNILNLLNPDDKEADAALQRVVEILDKCRDGTDFDIDQRTAEEMAKAMKEFMTKRKTSKLPRPKLITDQPKNEDMGMPLSLREFMPLEPFEDHHFKDFRDNNNEVVHSITSFLTVWSSLGLAPAAPVTGAGSSGLKPKSGGATIGGGSSSTSGSSTGSKSGSGSEDPLPPNQAGGTQAGGTSGQTGSGTTGTGAAGASGSSSANASSGGYAVNVNTAPIAVLKGLVDSREVPSRFWDELLEWRNLEDEEEKKKAEEQQQADGAEPPEELLDEYGQPIIKRRIFDSLAKLSEVEGYSDLPAEQQAKLNQLLTTQSQVFSIYIVARKSTAADPGADMGLTPAELRRREETGGDSLVRVVHAVYWRHKVGEDVKLTPVLRWEILDYLPYEVLDFPPEDR